MSVNVLIFELVVGPLVALFYGQRVYLYFNGPSQIERILYSAIVALFMFNSWLDLCDKIWKIAG